MDTKVLIGHSTGEYARRADFYDYLNVLRKPVNTIQMASHDRSPAHGRNTIFEVALEYECTHVLLLDDDMAFKEDSLEKLLENADKDLVSGLYLTRAYPHQPLVFDVADEEDGKCLYAYLEPDMPRLIPIVAAGFGFCLINTRVLKGMKKPWVRLGELDAQEWCDDIGFFDRFRKAGFQAYCDTTCLVGHIGTMIVWPTYQDGQWLTGYDTGGKGMISTPQVNPGQVYQKVPV